MIEVTRMSKIVLLYCTTPNCAVCRVVEPRIEEAAKEIGATVQHIDLTKTKDRKAVESHGIDINGYFAAPILFAVVDGQARREPVLIGQALTSAEIVRRVRR
jgi:thiol-disulfide isomerase/thioredoxin